MYSMKMYVSLTIEFVGLLVSGFVCYGLVSVYVDLSATVSCVYIKMPPPLSHGLMTMD